MWLQLIHRHDLAGWLWSLLVFAIHVAVIARAITRPNRTPASRAAWIAVILLLPVLGVIAYLFLGETSIGPARMRRLRQARTRVSLPDDASCPSQALAPHLAPLFDLARSIDGFGAVPGNRIEVLGDPDASAREPMRDSDIAIARLVADIGEAVVHVHVSFYIWLDDRNGGAVVDAVCAAAHRGVQCRVMVDALGSRAFIRSPRWRQLQDAGVRTVPTLNDIPRLGHLALGRVDLRNHRKIVVIDNRIAYCGSQNCADPEFRVEARFAPWIDILLRCEGPVVRHAQYIFLVAWVAETGEAQLEGLPAAVPRPQSFPAGTVARMFGTGPTTHGNAMSDMFVATIATARRELVVTTPYFAPDEALLRALCAAPRRGVRTIMVFPARNNSWLVGATGRSMYEDLLASGVDLREYPLGLLHAKSITVDGEVALVGSANMDRRSLQLNFENNLLVAGDDIVAAIRRRQESWLSVSTPLSLETVRAWSFGKQLVQDAVAIAAPLL